MIGREAQAQFERAGVYPDVMVGCTGGGSSFGGFIFPFRAGQAQRRARHALRGGRAHGRAQPDRRPVPHDFGDAAATTPLIKMYTLGHSFVPAPEPAHAVRVAIDEALRCKEAGESKVIAINLCGHGHFDMQAYRSFLDGQLVNYDYPQERITEALAELPAVG